LAVSALLCAVVTVIAGPQEKAKRQPAPQQKTGQAEKTAPALFATIPSGKGFAAIDKMFAAYDLTPHPLTAIPDNPPPHEGALIDLPYIVDPIDLILVEVLEALPGRPISGERLVQPDGRIDLGSYGEIPVRGLTPEQIKVAVIKHLRKFLSDEVLGLIVWPEEEPVEMPALEEPPTTQRPAIPELPKEDVSPFELERPCSAPRNYRVDLADGLDAPGHTERQSDELGPALQGPC
jgi:hypothetical protein